MKIVIDPGHGGKDGGAQGNALSEKVLTLEIAKRIQRQLSDYENVQLKMTRTDDRFLTLSERTDIANNFGADLFLSIHINSATDEKANGFETYIYNGDISTKTIAFQNVIHEEIMSKITGVQNRGKKRANFSVLRRSNMPAVLTENLFIVNKSDAIKLKDDTFLENLAKGHTIGLEKFLGLKRKTTEPNYPTGKMYMVQVGAFVEYDNAKNLFDKLTNDGYKPFIVEK